MSIFRGMGKNAVQWNIIQPLKRMNEIMAFAGHGWT